MSSVGPSSKKSQNDELREARENYRRKEAELIKRQNLEIADLNRRHERELRSVENRNDANLDRVRKSTQNAITRRDMHYQKEVDDLRKMHARQMEKLMAENQEKLARAEAANRNDLREAKLSKNDRVADLESQFQTERAADEKQFQNDVNQTREAEQKQTDEIRENLNKQHEKELNYLRNDRDEAVSRLEHDNNQMRRYYDRELQDQKIHNLQDKNRSESAFMDNMRQTEESNNAVLARERKGFNQDLTDIRSKYAKKRREDLESQTNMGNQFHDRIQNRIDDEIGDLRTKLADAKRQNTQSEISTQAKAKREIADMQNEYQTKFDYLEKARQNAVNQNNDINAAKIAKIRRQYDKEMDENSRYLQGQMNTDNLKNREALDDLNENSKAREKYLSDSAEARVDKIRNNANEEERQLRNHFKTDIKMQRDAFEDKKRDLVYNYTKSKSDTIRNIEARAAKQEVDNQEQVANLIDKFEHRIRSLNDQMVKERRQHDHHDQELVKELKRQEHQELDAQKIKYDEREHLAQLTHEREVQEINRRNQEKLDQVLTTMKKES